MILSQIFQNNKELPKMIRQIGEDKWNLGLAYKNEQNYEDLLVEYKPVWDWDNVPAGPYGTGDGTGIGRAPNFVGCWAWAIISLYDGCNKKSYKLTAYIDSIHVFRMWCSAMDNEQFGDNVFMEKKINNKMTDYLLRCRDTWKDLKPI
tara:strand:- start:326 stop:769 length:444 start_codon:yes stop_codon:yes gene_type:complete